MKGRATKAVATRTLRAVARRFGATETGRDAAYRGVGPELVRDWDWTGTPNWAIIWEGGPYDWALDAADDISVPGAFLEPYSGWALMVWPS